jgi:hypothetical protein
LVGEAVTEHDALANRKKMTVDDILNADFMLGADSEEDGEGDEGEVCSPLYSFYLSLNSYRKSQMPSSWETMRDTTTTMRLLPP